MLKTDGYVSLEKLRADTGKFSNGQSYTVFKSPNGDYLGQLNGEWPVNHLEEIMGLLNNAWWLAKAAKEARP